MGSLSFGSELPDTVEKISGVSEAQIGLINDLHDLFRERVALERGYAAKLQALTKRAVDKKSKRIAKLVLGDEPTKAWTEDTLKLSTFDNAYSKLLSSLENSAEDHIVLADSLSSQVMEDLKRLESKHEEARRKQGQFFDKIVADKEKTAFDRSKAKSKYDEECMEVESYRHKQDRATDDKHADRAAKQLEQQKTDMLNAKNTYLISISISNKIKNKFYEGDLPLVENQFQSLQSTLMASLITTLRHSQSLSETHVDSLKSQVASVQTALSEIDSVKVQELYIEYNRSPVPFKIPDDAIFEPCEGFYDTPEMNTESSPKVFLQNKLSRCRAKLAELEPLMETKRSESEKLESLVQAYRQNGSLGSAVEVLEKLVDAQQQLTYLSTSKEILSVEIDVISLALAGDEGAQQPHSFKSSSFSIPTQCGYCKSSIWGLSKQGKTCKLCHVSVHNKCELKTPADCPGGEGGHKRNTASVSSLSVIPSHQAITTEPPSASSFARPHEAAQEDSTPLATVVFDFVASSPFELSVTSGEQVHLMEVDDGSGWIKVSNSEGNKGLIPASYIELMQPDDEQASVRVSSAEGSGVYVRAIYNYDAQGPDEIALREGEQFELTAGPTGGQHYGEGWWEGIHPSGRKGIFPSNYVELTS